MATIKFNKNLFFNCRTLFFKICLSLLLFLGTTADSSNKEKTADLVDLQMRVRAMKTTIENAKKDQEQKLKNPSGISFDTLIDHRVNQTEGRLKAVFDRDVEGKCGEVLKKSKHAFKEKLNPYLHQELPKELEVNSKKLDAAKSRIEDLGTKIKECVKDASKCDEAEIKKEVTKAENHVKYLANIAGKLEMFVVAKNDVHASSLISEYVFEPVDECVKRLPSAI